MTDRKGDRNNHRNERWQRQQRKSDERVTGSWQLTFRMCDDRYISGSLLIFLLVSPEVPEKAVNRSMAYLPEHPTLIELQKYMDEVCKERGWVKDTYAEKFLLFIEEVGELAKAIRKTAGLYDEKATPKNMELEEEFADVLSYLLDLANYFQIDLEKAFREKERVNEGRTWE